MELTKFLRHGGLKVLASANLTSFEYALFLYFLDAYVTGLNPLPTNLADLSLLTGADRTDLRRAILSLSNRHMIQVQEKSTPDDSEAFVVTLQLQQQNWVIRTSDRVGPRDAVVYSFTHRQRGGDDASLLSATTTDPLPAKPWRHQQDKDSALSPWKQLLNAFLESHEIEVEDLDREGFYAKSLIERHPVEQLVGLVRHFKTRISSLGLLVNSWTHLYELY